MNQEKVLVTMSGFCCCVIIVGTNDSSALCDKTTGHCVCKGNVEGRTCNQCSTNSFNLTEGNPSGCQSCNCDPTGTEGGSTINADLLSCHQTTGQCACLTDRIGIRCDDCNPGNHLLHNAHKICKNEYTIQMYKSLIFFNICLLLNIHILWR